MAVAVTSLLFLPAYFVFNFARVGPGARPATLDALAWGIVGARVLLPLGFLIALLQAERFAGRGAARAARAARRAGRRRSEWRDTIAEALDDPSLRLGYHDPATRTLPRGRRRASSRRPAAAPAGRGCRSTATAQPVAAMVVDETLTEDPELVRAAASATLLAVENGELEGELRASRARILEAGHAERRRIERDLHDSAQQRLVALRIHLTLAGEQLEAPQERAMIERLGAEVDEAIDELRDVAHGVYPPVLGRRGLGAALRAVARRSAIPVRVRDDGLRATPRRSRRRSTSAASSASRTPPSTPGRARRPRSGCAQDERPRQLLRRGRRRRLRPCGGPRAALASTNLADRVAAVGGTARGRHPPRTRNPRQRDASRFTSVAGAGLDPLAVELVQAALLAERLAGLRRCRRRACWPACGSSVSLTSARMIVTCSALGGSV